MSIQSHRNQPDTESAQVTASPPLPPQFEEVVYRRLAKGDVIKEYDLMKHLVTQGFTQFTPSLDPLALFRGHFLLFHLLYRLQEKWQNEAKGLLCIHTLEICLQPNRKSLENTAFALTEADEIKRYYLDYNTFLTTQAQDVVNLIEQFWQSFGSQPSQSLRYSDAEITEAKQCLKISTPLDVQTGSQVVMKQFRKLSQTHHPDKGGDAEDFHAICHAKEVLLSLWSR